MIPGRVSVVDLGIHVEEANDAQAAVGHRLEANQILDPTDGRRAAVETGHRIAAEPRGHGASEYREERSHQWPG